MSLLPSANKHSLWASQSATAFYLLSVTPLSPWKVLHWLFHLRVYKGSNKILKTKKDLSLAFAWILLFLHVNFIFWMGFDLSSWVWFKLVSCQLLITPQHGTTLQVDIFFSFSNSLSACSFNTLSSGNSPWADQLYETTVWLLSWYHDLDWRSKIYLLESSQDTYLVESNK